MSAFLAEPLAIFALCWRIERRDGVALGCTAHDRDLVTDGFRYRAAPGITPSAIEQADPLDDGGLDMAGALSAGAIDEADLLAGRWDGAAVTLFAVDWSDPSQSLQLMRGELGQVAIERGQFTVELKGPGAALAMAVSEETSPTCRAQLGDRRCRVNLAAHTTEARITSAADVTMELSVSEASPNAWGKGRLRWLGGANAGLASIIRSSNAAAVALAAPPQYAVQVGDRVRLEEGCDKRFATCRDRFDNALNFRGEPHLPGVDLLTRYPGE